MKIGILTFHCAHNYGAVLQAYALQEYLRSQKHDVFVIDYQPPYLRNGYKKWNLGNWLSKNPSKMLRKIIHEPFLLFDRLTRYNNFNEFIHTKLHLYPFCASGDFSEFDFIILGSDQIWNRKLTGNYYDNVYFGTQMKCSVISYAASNGCITLSEEDKDYFTGQFSHIKAIGVREDFLCNQLQGNTTKIITQTLDPTLLAGEKYFDSIVLTPATDKPYVMVYEMESRIAMSVARKIALRENMDILELTSSVKYPGNTRKIQSASPEEFLGYLKKADYVVTTSFHGLAFSLLFNKQFSVIKQNTPNDRRIDALLQLLDLSDRFIESDDLPTDIPINYSQINRILENERHKSETFLLDALNNLK